MNIIVIGDSHTHLFHEKLAIFSPGAITANNFSTDSNPLKIKIDEHLKLSDEKYDTVVLCLGEIDIRAHYWRDIPIYNSRGVSLDTYVNTQVKQFIEAVIKFKQEHKVKNILIWGVPPASSQNRGERNFFMTGMGAYNPELPHVGSQLTRNIITHKFNRQIINYLQVNAEYGIKYLTAFYNFVDEDFNTVANNLSDGVHYDPSFTEMALDLILHVLEKPELIWCSQNISRLDKKIIAFELRELITQSEINYDVWAEDLIDFEIQVPLRNVPFEVENNSVLISLLSAPVVRQITHTTLNTLSLVAKNEKNR
jgi:lysophospholipase L1-like esterase